MLVCGGLRRIDNAQTEPVAINDIQQKTASQDIRRCQVHLKPRQIAAGETPRLILPVWQPVYDIDVVEPIQPVMKPRAARRQRSGELHARRPFVDVKSALGRDSRNEIGSGKAPAVVAHFGLYVEYAGRPAPVLRREPAA